MPGSRRESGAGKETEHAERVIVKFTDGVNLPYGRGVEKQIAERKLGPIEALVKQTPGIAFTPLFPSVSAKEIGNLTKKAQASDPKYQPPDFLAFFAVETPKGTDRSALAKQLMGWASIDYAYAESLPLLAALPPTSGEEGAEPFRPPDPPAPVPDDPRIANQGYLWPAPGGIGVASAWAVEGGSGAGVRFVDIEYAWKVDYDQYFTPDDTRFIPTHEDFVGQNFRLLPGYMDMRAGEGRGLTHGTKVLGVVAAVDNTIGCIGIAPHVREIGLAPLRRTKLDVSPPVYSMPDAMLSALVRMEAGDVLLLELQTGRNDPAPLAPIEWEPAVLEAIRLATALGVVVIEPAGNGGLDLDELTVDSSRYGHALPRTIKPLSRADASFIDSGAILVGAGTSAHPRQRRDSSCYGSRVDCHAWGDDVQTLTATGDGLTDAYTDSTSHFNGTSAAAAIVAGVAVVTQGMALKHLRRPLTPLEMRDILSRPPSPRGDARFSHTPSANPREDLIGVMPNLRAIVTYLDAMRLGG